MKRETIRIFALAPTLLIGVLWVVVVLLLALFAGGWAITSLVSGLRSVFGLAAMFAAPLCLVSGSILALSRKAPRFSFGACALGSVCLTAVVGSWIYDQFHLNSAEIPSSLLFLSTFVVAAFLCDASSIWLGLDLKRSRSNSGV